MARTPYETTVVEEISLSTLNYDDIVTFPNLRQAKGEYIVTDLLPVNIRVRSITDPSDMFRVSPFLAQFKRKATAADKKPVSAKVLQNKVNIGKIVNIVPTAGKWTCSPTQKYVVLAVTPQRYKVIELGGNATNQPVNVPQAWVTVAK